MYQKWIYDEEAHTLHPLAHESSNNHIIAMEGMTNGNIATYKESEGKIAAQQKFTYDPKKQYWRRDGSDHIIGFNWESWLANDNVFTYKESEIKNF